MISAFLSTDSQILRRLVLLGAGILILGLGIGIGSSLNLAGLSDAEANDGLHHACVSRHTKNMRYVYDVAQCAPNETPISWGEQNFSEHERVLGEDVLVGIDETGITNVTCPGGKKLLGGGGTASSIAEIPSVAEPVMFWSYPLNDNTWRIAVHNDTEQEQTMRAYAICALVTP